MSGETHPGAPPVVAVDPDYVCNWRKGPWGSVYRWNPATLRFDILVRPPDPPRAPQPPQSIAGRRRRKRCDHPERSTVTRRDGNRRCLECHREYARSHRAA